MFWRKNNFFKKEYYLLSHKSLCYVWLYSNGCLSRLHLTLFIFPFFILNVLRRIWLEYNDHASFTCVYIHANHYHFKFESSIINHYCTGKTIFSESNAKSTLKRFIFSRFLNSFFELCCMLMQMVFPKYT